MAVSVFDLFKVGIGPSSSHTVGPMRAAGRFLDGLRRDGELESTARVTCDLYGSLGATGKGHGSDTAVLMGLEGHRPESVDPGIIAARVAAIRERGSIALLGEHAIAFAGADLVFQRRKSLPHHPNGMRFRAFDAAGTTLRERVYYSVGGGFVVDEEAAGADRIKADDTVLPHPFASADALLAQCRETGLSISELMDSPVSRHCASSSSALPKGCGSTVSSALMRSAPAASSSTTKPPPTE